jgi:CRISPR-associated protein Cas2
MYRRYLGWQARLLAKVLTGERDYYPPLLVKEEAGGQRARMRSQARTNKQSTCSVMAYNIANDKKRTKVHKILLDYGKWTQYSLFECFLTKKQLVLLRSKLSEHLAAQEDSVRFYPLCANCVSKVETIEGPPPADEILFLV